MSKQIVIAFCLALVIGGSGGYWYASGEAQKGPDMAAAMSKQERKPLFYRNAMNPAVTSPVPAKDSMGMDYVPVYAEELSGGGKPGTVVIDPKVIQSIGVRTTVATRKKLSHTIQTTGRVAYDEDLLFRLHPKISGWIEKLFVSETGTAVKPGTMLLSIYSPQLVSSQEEYLLAIKNAKILAKSPFADVREGAQDLLRSSRERLELLDVPAHQMRDLKKTHKIIKALHIHSSATGIVLEIGAREGQHVTPQTELYKIADLSRIWAYVDVYEYELPWVRLHDTAEMRLEAYPDRVFKGKVTYIYPYLDPKTRTNKVRLEFENSNLALKPDMFADVTLHAGRKLDALVIPTAAIIRTGKIPKVFVQTGHGSFEPRSVRLGPEANDETEILSGVEEGERVVTSAQFLLDSESSLTEAAAKMVEPEKNSMGTQESADMKGMKMDQEEKQ
ncbi:MAG: efflux RND transporter periplasmic adaptor subunit [Gammaproteobacteria bacterium]